MKLYKSQTVFNRKTGKPDGEEFFETNDFVCDYSGNLIKCDNRKEVPQYHIKINYNHDYEEVYYYDDIKEKFDELDINYHSLFSQPFTFIVYEDYSDASTDLMREWIENVRKNKKSQFYGCSTMEEAMRISRVRVILRLLKDKTFTRDQLGLNNFGDN